ncbi:MAG: bifunctional folylpolyglutamate synthase/dihydrofolate synthase [Lachnospiraceae bacterium]|nr:bifunctional folylpolyglutamate synthase/dihydrofolate synthase [Lachnospiraceae bacterium]
MRYNEALEYMAFISSNKGIVPGLESIKELCKRLGDPQDKLKFIHIAGTNGKGSTLAFISSVLTCSGYRVGRYISPTIRDYRERFQINSKMISQSMFSEILEEVKTVCDKMENEGLSYPTAFEIETAIAFLYFLKKNCDIVVLECGMGGKDDATNVINTTVLSVITPISMDHMQFLGDSLEKIAMNKCGIIKSDIPVVSGIQQKQVYDVIKKRCKDKNCDLYTLDKESITDIKYSLVKQSFKLDKTKYEIKLIGVWQIENAALSIKALKVIRDAGYKKITDESIRKGLLSAEWPARFQVVSKKPLLIIDGAHNEDAALRLKESIDIYLKDKEKIFILGMFRDKAVEAVIKTLVLDAKMIFTCQAPNNPRALRAVELADMVSAFNKNVTCCDSVEEAVEFAFSMADENTAIIATGSLAYLGRVLDMYLK